MPPKGGKVVVQNRRARHDYFIEETWEAGSNCEERKSNPSGSAKET